MFPDGETCSGFSAHVDSKLSMPLQWKRFFVLIVGQKGLGVNHESCVIDWQEKQQKG